MNDIAKILNNRIERVLPRSVPVLSRFTEGILILVGQFIHLLICTAFLIFYQGLALILNSPSLALRLKAHFRYAALPDD